MDKPSFESERTSSFFRQSQHRPLNGISDELLDFRGRQRRSFGHNDHLIVGEIRERLDGNRVQRVPPPATTQSPHEVWMAIGQKAWAPRFPLRRYAWCACPGQRFVSA